MLPFVYIEAVTFVEYGPTRRVALRCNSLRAKWVRMPGSSQGPLAQCCRWLNIWNAMDLVAYILQASSRHSAVALSYTMLRKGPASNGSSLQGCRGAKTLHACSQHNMQSRRDFATMKSLALCVAGGHHHHACGAVCLKV